VGVNEGNDTLTGRVGTCLGSLCRSKHAHMPFCISVQTSKAAGPALTAPRAAPASGAGARSSAGPGHATSASACTALPTAGAEHLTDVSAVAGAAASSGAATQPAPLIAGANGTLSEQLAQSQMGHSSVESEVSAYHSVAGWTNADDDVGSRNISRQNSWHSACGSSVASFPASPVACSSSSMKRSSSGKLLLSGAHAVPGALSQAAVLLHDDAPPMRRSDSSSKDEAWPAPIAPLHHTHHHYHHQPSVLGEAPTPPHLQAVLEDAGEPVDADPDLDAQGSVAALPQAAAAAAAAERVPGLTMGSKPNGPAGPSGAVQRVHSGQAYAAAAIVVDVEAAPGATTHDPGAAPLQPSSSAREPGSAAAAQPPPLPPAVEGAASDDAGAVGPSGADAPLTHGSSLAREALVQLTSDLYARQGRPCKACQVLLQHCKAHGLPPDALRQDLQAHSIPDAAGIMQVRARRAGSGSGCRQRRAAAC
jgi:hypothetical protein